MRKIFLVMLVAMVAAVSCQKSELSGTSFTGNEFEMTITANLSDGSSATRAIDNYGTGNKVTRCIMEVYYIGADGTADSELYQRMYSAVDADSKTASFDIRLVDGQTYDFLFWADCGDTSNLETDVYYNTAKLTEVTAIGYDNYNTYGDKRDAFFGSELAVKVSEQAVAFDVELRRPFGQLNVFSKFTDVMDQQLAALTPTKVQYTYTKEVCNTLDVKTGIASGSETLAWADSRNIIDDLSSTGYTHLSTDYIFAPLDETGSTQTLVDFTLTFYNAAGEAIMSNDAFVNIPIQRNYRTNVYGELMTVNGEITVEVIPEFETPDIEATVVTSVDQVSDALRVVEEGEDANVTVSDEVTGDNNHITVPNSNEKTGETSITVTFENVDPDAEISFGGEDSSTSSDYDGTVYINAPDGVEFTDLTVNLPEAHVVFNGVAVYGSISTSGTTFVVAEGASFETLTIYAGNLEIYGKVSKVVRGEGNEGSITVTLYGDVEEPVIDPEDGITVVSVNDEPEVDEVITVDDSGDVYQTIKDAIDGGATSVSIYVDDKSADKTYIPATDIPITIEYPVQNAGAYMEIYDAGDTDSDDNEIYYTGKLTLITADDGKHMEVILPYATVDFYGSGEYVYVATGGDTFIVGVGASIFSLEVISGNVGIYGYVKDIGRSSKYNTDDKTTVTIYEGGELEDDPTDEGIIVKKDGEEPEVDYTATKTVETDDEATAWMEEAAEAGADSISVIITGVDESGYPVVRLPETSSSISVKFADDQTDQIIMFEGGTDFTGELTIEMTGDGFVQPNTSNASKVYFYGSANVISVMSGNCIVTSGASVVTLEIAEGDADIYGTVTTVQRTYSNPDEFTYVNLIGEAAEPAINDEEERNPEKVILLRDGVVIEEVDYTATKTVATCDEANEWIAAAVAADATSVSVIITQAIEAKSTGYIYLPETGIPISVKFSEEQVADAMINLMSGDGSPSPYTNTDYTGELTIDVTGDAQVSTFTVASTTQFKGSAFQFIPLSKLLTVTSEGNIDYLIVTAGDVEIVGSVSDICRIGTYNDTYTYVDLIGEAAEPTLSGDEADQIILMRDGVVIEDEEDYDFTQMIYVETADEAVAAITAAEEAGVENVTLGYQGTYNETGDYYEYDNINFTGAAICVNVSIEYLNQAKSSPYFNIYPGESYQATLSVTVNQSDASLTINEAGKTTAKFYGQLASINLSSNKLFTSTAGSVIGNLYLYYGNDVDLYGEVTTQIKNSSLTNTSTINIYDGAVEPVTYEGNFTLYKNGILYVRAYDADDVAAAISAATAAISIGYYGTLDAETGYYTYGDVVYESTHYKEVSIEFLNQAKPSSTTCFIYIESLYSNLNVTANQADMNITVGANATSEVNFYGKIGTFIVWAGQNSTVTSTAGSVINYLKLTNGSNVDLYGEVTSTIENSSNNGYATTVNIYEGAVEPENYVVGSKAGEFIRNDYR